MDIVARMKERYVIDPEAIVQEPLVNCPDCSGTGEAYNARFKLPFVCMCMTVHCAGMSDEERFKHMKRTIELRAMVWSIKA